MRVVALIDVCCVDTNPGQRQAIDLLPGPRPEPQPGEQPRRPSARRRCAAACRRRRRPDSRRRRSTAPRSAIRRAATGAAHPGASGRWCRRRRAADRASGSRSRGACGPRVVISHITGTGDGADTSSSASGIFMAGTTPIEISDGAPVSPPPSAARTSSLTAGCWSGRGASGARSAIHSAWSALAGEHVDAARLRAARVEDRHGLVALGRTADPVNAGEAGDQLAGLRGLGVGERALDVRLAGDRQHRRFAQRLERDGPVDACARVAA